jgi:hypothetical protein
MEAFALFYVERYGVCKLSGQSNAYPRLSFLLLHMITLSKLQVFEMVPRIARKYYQYSMITLILRTLMILT